MLLQIQSLISACTLLYQAKYYLSSRPEIFVSDKKNMEVSAIKVLSIHFMGVLPLYAKGNGHNFKEQKKIPTFHPT